MNRLIRRVLAWWDKRHPDNTRISWLAAWDAGPRKLTRQERINIMIDEGKVHPFWRDGRDRE